MALYGGSAASQRRLLTGRELIVASKLPWNRSKGVRDRYPLRPWLTHNGFDVDAARRVICTLELLSPGQWLDASLELLVRMAYRPGHSHYGNLRGSDRKTADALIDALRGARDLLSRGKTPAGAISHEIWWSGDARYVGGRAPMPRMQRLPDEILRHVCDFLASDPGADQAAQRSLLESREFCSDWNELGLSGPESGYLAYPEIIRHELVPSFEKLNDMGDIWVDVRFQICAGIKNLKPCLAAALRLRAVSSAWSSALLKRTAFLRGRVARLVFERNTLDDIERVAGGIYRNYYADDIPPGDY